MPASVAYHYARSFAVFLLLFAEVTFVGAALAFLSGTVTWLQAGMVGITGLVSGCATFGLYLLLAERYWRLVEQMDGEQQAFTDRRVEYSWERMEDIERLDETRLFVRRGNNRREFPPFPQPDVDEDGEPLWAPLTLDHWQLVERWLHHIRSGDAALNQRDGKEFLGSRERGAAVKEWCVGLGWYEVTNELRGNGYWTEQGQQALEMLRDESLLRVATAPPPRASPNGNRVQIVE